MVGGGARWTDGGGGSGEEMRKGKRIVTSGC